MILTGSKTIRLGVVLLLALLIVNGLLSYLAVRILRERRANVRHIYDAQRALEQLFSVLKDAESGQRGYIYTGDPAYLQPYTAAIPQIKALSLQIDPDFDRTKASADLKDQLDNLIERKLAELAKTVELRRDGRTSDLRTTVEAGTGKEVMDSIRSTISQLEKFEDQQMNESVTRQQEADSYLVATLAFASGTAFLFVLLFAAALERETRRVRELQQAEKLATTGRMAATVAHEINNPLEAATNLIYLATTDPTVPGPVKDLLDLADRELARVAHMTKQTLGFYKSATSAETVNVPDLLDEVVRLFDSKLQGKNLSVTRQYLASCSMVTNRGELFQVITNIFSNAIDASYSGGNITLGCSREANGIAITVEDFGTGIAKDVERDIFKAFVTTKKNVGTGLGLWVSERLVAKHGGRITVQSLTSGRKGSLFKVWFPAAVGEKKGNSAASGSLGAQVL